MSLGYNIDPGLPPVRKFDKKKLRFLACFCQKGPAFWHLSLCKNQTDGSWAMLFGLYDTHTNVSKISQYQPWGATVQDLTYPHRGTFGSFLAFFGEAEKHVFFYVKIGTEGRWHVGAYM